MNVFLYKYGYNSLILKSKSKGFEKKELGRFILWIFKKIIQNLLYFCNFHHEKFSILPHPLKGFEPVSQSRPTLHNISAKP